MRSLAAEAGCATGLPYKVFADRHEIVLEIVHGELVRLNAAEEDLARRAGRGQVGANLAWFADEVLGSPAVAFVHEVSGDDGLSKQFTHRVHGTGVGPNVIERVFASYLAAEQQAGRIDPSIETDVFAFLLGGAVHNLIVSGETYPRPTKRQLQQHLTSVANALATRP
jgi:AcrR family transcriptional regulator